MQDAF